MIEYPEEHRFNEISIGDKKSFKIKIEEKMIEEFAKLSGDYNPLHMDEKYAKNTKFKKRICHGMLLSSFFSRLIGMYLPGKNALYFSQSLNFLEPCFLDDTIVVEGEVIDKSEAMMMITISTKILSNSRKCVEGNAKVLMRE